MNTSINYATNPIAITSSLSRKQKLFKLMPYTIDKINKIAMLQGLNQSQTIDLIVKKIKYTSL